MLGIAWAFLGLAGHQAKQPPGASDDDDEAAYQAKVAERQFQENCLICHEAEMTTRQRLTPGQWKTEIEKMISWGAPLPAEARQPLTDYLSRQYSDRQPLPEPRRVKIRETGSLELSNPASLTISTRDINSGERLYAANCANCHGPKALGAELGPCLVDKAILAHPEAYHRVVRDGLRKMPGFRSALTAAQQEDLLSWLRQQRYPCPAEPGRPGLVR
jgi:ubiquinol-cytochrome c reductase cytochrome c subunit